MENRHQLAYHQRLSDQPYIFILSIPAFTSSPLSTHLVTCSLIIFILIRSLIAQQGFNFIIVSIGLLPPLIYLISAISLLLYNYYRHIRSTISYFSYIILSLTKQLYKDFKSVQRITSSHSNCRIFSIVTLIAVLVSNLQAILYNLDAKTLYITYLYLIDN